MTIIKQLEHESKYIFIFGDLNCDLLGNRSHRATSLLNSFAQIYQLQQLIDEPTRCTASTRTLIDVVLYTNCPSKVAASGVIHLGLSDHDLIYAIRKVAIEPIVNKHMHKVVNIRNMKIFNVVALLYK